MLEGTCPVCIGSGRISAGHSRYKEVVAGYDAATDTLSCHNCGGQYMFSWPKGLVKLNREGVPCTHSYEGRNAGGCLTEYTCSHCDDRYQIDSGD